MFDWIGWIATAVFAGSYLCKEPQSMRRVQAVGAACWLVYGVLIHSAPIVVSNIIVAGVAVFSSLRRRSPVELPEAA